jgi:probable rRNA maturation factor
MEVTLHLDQNDLPLDPHSVRAVVREVLSFEDSSPDEVIVHFVSNEVMCEIHADQFDDPSLTDCMTFPIDPVREGPFQLLGEVFVCPYIAVQSAPEHGVSPHQECTLYLVHTLLHLLGFRDETEEESAVMRAKESEHMQHLSKKNLLLKGLDP